MNFNTDSENNTSANNIFSLSNNEEKILQQWTKTNVVQQLKELRKDSEEWNFLDGPPFVNGNPHHGHLLVSTIKDVLARHNSNLGKKVSYQIGFDCHGLPMEQAAENEIGKKMCSDANIDEIRIFNQKCQEIQDRSSDRFESVLSRLGRQFESDKTYYTSDINYMNALWISFRKLFDKGLIYRGKKVMPYSYGCQTALSNFEANQNYKMVSHTSVYLKFKIENRHNEYFLVWTTTPWSLLSNQALCLNPMIEYILVESDENYWIAKDLYSSIFKKNEPILKTVTGKELGNIRYVPPFNLFNQEQFITLVDEYVTSDSGTGIVHIAPLFGADDFRICMTNNIINSKATNLPDFIDSEAKIKPSIDIYINDEPIKNRLILDLSDLIIRYLKNNKMYFKKESTVHKYPYCWRTDTPLIYLAQDCWFLNVQDIKQDLIANNSKIQWFPESVGTSRFNNWLEGAPDWCLSRNRFWGTPIPIWKSYDDEYICITSIEDLQQYTDKVITNLHREYIDDIIIIKDGKEFKRIDAVFDCWYESGLAGIAKEGKQCEQAKYPVDFIAESLDQTRGWFYTLNVLSTALYNEPAFKKVIVSGLILASDGTKMSKRLNNYTPPDDILKKYGADVLRLYLLSSPATQAQEFKFNDSELAIFTRKVLPYFHAHKMLYESIENIRRTDSCIELYNLTDQYYNSTDKLDIWLFNLTNKLQLDINNSIEKLELYKIPVNIFNYIDNLTNIWIKFSRDRLKDNCDTIDTINSINTLYRILNQVNIILSPIIPFNTDFLYQYLRWIVNHTSVDDIIEYNSIHLLVTNNSVTYDSKIIDSMNNVNSIIEIVRMARHDMKIKLHTYDRPSNSPIRNMQVYLPKIYKNNIDPYFDKYIKEQCNVENLNYFFETSECTIEPNKGTIGKMFKKEGSNVIKLINTSTMEELVNNKVYYNDMLITSDFFKLSTNIIEKEHFYTIQSGIYLILLDTTFDQDLLSKMKLSLLKREIQDIRKKLNYNIWDKLDVVIDEESYTTNKYLNEWKEYFETTINSKVRVESINADSYTFNYENETIRFNLTKIN